MRAALVALTLLLAGCATPPPDDGGGPSTTTSTTDSVPTVTCPDTSTSGVPRDCSVGDCAPFISFHHAYAAAGVDNTSSVRAWWSHHGLGIVDLQDESDHEHIQATGQGRFNNTTAGGQAFEEWYEPYVRPEHAVLAWSAATSSALEAAFCDAWDDVPYDTPFNFTAQPGGRDWIFVSYGGYDPNAKHVRSDSALARAFCDAWNQTWTDAGVEISGGQHGNICRSV